MVDKFISGSVEIPQYTASEPSVSVATQLTNPKTTKNVWHVYNGTANKPTEKPKQKKQSRKETSQPEKEKSKDKTQPTGEKLGLAEFGVKQETTLPDETCKDVKQILKAVQQLERNLEDLQKTVEESTIKLTQHIAMQVAIVSLSWITCRAESPPLPITQSSQMQNVHVVSSLPIAPAPETPQPHTIQDSEVPQPQMESPLQNCVSQPFHITQPCSFPSDPHHIHISHAGS